MSEEEKEFKADHFENIEELVKTCKMWVTDDDYDAYCRFFDMGAMEEILNLISTLQKELDKKDICLKTCEESLTKERQERIKLNKVIEEMGIALMHNKNSRFYNMTLAEVEQYFYKKAEE